QRGCHGRPAARERLRAGLRGLRRARGGGAAPGEDRSFRDGRRLRPGARRAARNRYRRYASRRGTTLVDPTIRCIRVLFVSTVLLVAAISSAAANSVAVPPPPALKAFSYVLIDAHSGALLAEYAADAATAPGDLTKLMTAYVVFEALEQGRLALDESVSVSEDALRAPGQRMFIESDHRVTVHDLLKGLVVQAANDAAIALAEHVAGSESAFVQEMNERAELLGMTATAYRNSTGAAAEDQVTTARDAATLAQAIIANFPNHYPLYSQRELTYNEITQHNPNALLW